MISFSLMLYLVIICVQYVYSSLTIQYIAPLVRCLMSLLPYHICYAFILAEKAIFVNPRRSGSAGFETVLETEQMISKLSLYIFTGNLCRYFMDISVNVW